MLNILQMLIKVEGQLLPFSEIPEDLFLNEVCVCNLLHTRPVYFVSCLTKLIQLPNDNVKYDGIVQY